LFLLVFFVGFCCFFGKVGLVFPSPSVLFGHQSLVFFGFYCFQRGLDHFFVPKNFVTFFFFFLGKGALFFLGGPFCFLFVSVANRNFFPILGVVSGGAAGGFKNWLFGKQPNNTTQNKNQHQQKNPKHQINKKTTPPQAAQKFVCVGSIFFAFNNLATLTPFFPFPPLGFLVPLGGSSFKKKTGGWGGGVGPFFFVLFFPTFQTSGGVGKKKISICSFIFVLTTQNLFGAPSQFGGMVFPPPERWSPGVGIHVFFLVPFKGVTQNRPPGPWCVFTPPWGEALFFLQGGQFLCNNKGFEKKFRAPLL